MTDPIYPTQTSKFARRRRDLRPETEAAFRTFSNSVFVDGALTAKMKQIMAVALAHVTQCPYCIKGHTKAAIREGASDEELMEAIWVAAEMRAGAAFAHSALALEEMEKGKGGQRLNSAQPLRLRNAQRANASARGRHIW